MMQKIGNERRVNLMKKIFVHVDNNYLNGQLLDPSIGAISENGDMFYIDTNRLPSDKVITNRIDGRRISHASIFKKFYSNTPTIIRDKKFPISTAPVMYYSNIVTSSTLVGSYTGMIQFSKLFFDWITMLLEESLGDCKDFLFIVNGDNRSFHTIVKNAYDFIREDNNTEFPLITKEITDQSRFVAYPDTVKFPNTRFMHSLLNAGLLFQAEKESDMGLNYAESLIIQTIKILEEKDEGDKRKQ